MQQFSINLAKLTLLLVVVAGVACKQDHSADTSRIAELESELSAAKMEIGQATAIFKREAARATERTPAEDYGDTFAAGAMPVPEVTLADLLDVVKKGGPACPSDVNTFVRKERGTDCDTYQAEIAGWADKCVVECDNAARLAEAVADAQLTCAAWCQTKKCPGPKYAAPRVCAAASCYQSKECPAACPLINSCFLLQAGGVWNCQCVEI